MKTPKQLKHSDIKSLRKHILKKQNGKCWICGEVPKVPCLDHHHKKRIKGTGLVRGVLCPPCNIFIAKAENNAMRYGVTKEELPNRLRKQAEYLEKKHYPYLHPSEKPKEPKLSKRSYNKLVKLHKENLERPKADGSGRVPKLTEFPKSGKLTKSLKVLYNLYDLEPEFLKKR